MFTPEIFRTVPVGQYAGQLKYWPWFWLIVPVYLIVTPLSVLLALPFDHQSLVQDVKKLRSRLRRKRESAIAHQHSK